MKIALMLSGLVLMLAALPVHAEIVFGPINNPNNGHDYYLLTPNSWTASEAEAEKLGGTLAVIKNAAEEHWIFSTFASQGNANRSLWIGLRRTSPGGPFQWVNGQATNSTYLNWCDTQPDNGGGVEDKVEIWTPYEGWNDARDDEQHYAVVEMPQDLRAKAFTKMEKSLIGAWYQSGRPDEACYITRTENRLFIITYDGRGGMLVTDASGVIIPSWNMHGEIVEDRILWSNGTWWSRKVTNDAADGPPFPRPATFGGFPGFAHSFNR
ncbi:MAG TPA: lectin-like protein [Verrucomicrobiae bacterium]